VGGTDQSLHAEEFVLDDQLDRLFHDLSIASVVQVVIAQTNDQVLRVFARHSELKKYIF
jgi:hypothetical protein